MCIRQNNVKKFIPIIIAIAFIVGVCCINYGAYYKQPLDYKTTAEGISLERGNYRVEISEYDLEPDSYAVMYEVNNQQYTLTAGDLMQKEGRRFFDMELPSNIRNGSIKIHLYAGGEEDARAQVVITKTLYHVQTVAYLVLYVLLFAAAVVIREKEDRLFHCIWGLESVILLMLYPIFREYPFRIAGLIVTGIATFWILYKRKQAAGENMVRYLFFLAFAMTVMLLCSESSPIYTMNPWDDANIYYAIGRGVSQGLVPYRDMFDHKGPAVFFLYTLGYLLSPDKFYGIYILESISFSIVLYFAYKIYHIFFGKEASGILAVVSAAFLANRSFIVYGASCEEFVMPIYFVFLYTYLEYFRHREDVSGYRLFGLGVICGIVFWMKFNLIVCPVAWLFFMLLDRWMQTRRFRKDIGVLILGGITASIPIVGYFVYYHSLVYLIKGYFVANLAYADVKTIWETISTFAGNIMLAVGKNPVVTFLVIIGLAGYLCFNRMKGNICGKTGMILAFLGMIGSTYVSYAYDYYYCVVAVFMVLGVITIAEIIRGKKTDIRIQINAIVPVTVLCILAIPLYNRNYEDAIALTDNLSLYDVCNIEMENAGIDKTLLMYRNHWVQMMLPEGTRPAAQYFFAPNISKHYTEILEEQDRYIHEGLANFIIIDDVDLYPTLEEWGLYQYEQIVDWRTDRNSVQLYRIKERNS